MDSPWHLETPRMHLHFIPYFIDYNDFPKFNVKRHVRMFIFLHVSNKQCIFLIIFLTLVMLWAYLNDDISFT